jgi:hypothetical protein
VKLSSHDVLLVRNGRVREGEGSQELSGSWAPVILAMKGGRDQEDRGSKPAWADSWRGPNSKISITKQREALSSNPSAAKKKKLSGISCSTE